MYGLKGSRAEDRRQKIEDSHQLSSVLCSLSSVSLILNKGTRMTAYLIRRILLLIPVVVGVLTLIFLMRALVPGDPIEIMFMGQMPPDPKVVADIRHEL